MKTLISHRNFPYTSLLKEKQRVELGRWNIWEYKSQGTVMDRWQVWEGRLKGVWEAKSESSVRRNKGNRREILWWKEGAKEMEKEKEKKERCKI